MDPLTLAEPLPTASEQPQPVKVAITPLFSSWVYRCETGPVHLNEKLDALAHTLMNDDRNASRRTNFGGWHYAFDLFQLRDPAVEGFRGLMEQHVQAYLNHFRPEGRKKQDSFTLAGWINV